MKNWQKLSFCVPITESSSSNGEFLIRGVAINATTTRNRTRFEAAELQASAPSLRQKPLLKDHNNSVDSIVGRTTQNVNFDQQVNGIVFEARVVDETMQKKINAGLIQNVSIGALLHQDPEVIKDSEGNVEAIVAKGIEFVELSLVAVPADPNAGFAKALMESFETKRKEESMMTNTAMTVSIPVSASSIVTSTAGITSSGVYTSGTQEASYACTECKQKFGSKQSLAAHMSKAHPDATDNDTADDGDGDEQKLTSSRKVEAAMAEEQKTLEALRAEREQLEAEVETMRIEKLSAQKAELQKKEEAKTEVEADQTKGVVATTEANNEPYLLEQNGKKVSITADVQAVGGRFSLEKAPRYF